MDGRWKAPRQCIAISKVISGGSEQRLILTTESKVRSGSRENISESFFPAAGEKVGTKDGGLNCFFSDHEYGDLQTERKKTSTQTTERKERERGLALLSLLFPLIRPPNEQKVDGWEPLKTKV